MTLSREQFAQWRPAVGRHVEVQQALPFEGKHQAMGFKEFPMKEEQVAPVMDPMSEAHARSMQKAPTGETRPIEHVYRGMSHEEWNQAQERGHLRSDARGAIAPEWEGTNAALDPKSAHYYRDTTGGGKGVVAKIAVHPDDKWFLSDVDSYARTRSTVPLSRVQILDTK
mgnify:CR=1 FL=1|jgi:hypothetical protein